MPALVVLSHGSQRNPASSVPAYEHANRIRDTDAFDVVKVGFWKEEPHISETLRTVRSSEIYAVPLFISEGYFTMTVLPRELRLQDWDQNAWGSTDGVSATPTTHQVGDTDATVQYCGPVGTHKVMSDVILQRARSILDQPITEDVGLAIVGHGTERNEQSAKAIEYHAERIRNQGLFGRVRALYMDEEPEIDDVTAYFDTSRIVVVPLFIADGYHTQEDIPEDMGLPWGPDGYQVPATVDGRELWYTGAVGTEPLLATVILERAAQAGASVEDAIAQLRERTQKPVMEGDH